MMEFVQFAQGILEGGGGHSSVWEWDMEQGHLEGDDIWSLASGKSGVSPGSGKGRSGEYYQQEEHTQPKNYSYLSNCKQFYVAGT